MTEQDTISSDMHGEEEHFTNRHHKTQTSVNQDDEVKSAKVRHTSMSSSKMVHGYRQAQTTEAKIYETAEENHLILEIEEDNETLQEAIKINKVLGNSQTQNDLVIKELLQKLQGMDLNIQILKATMIGATVTALRKHGSKQVRKHARALISKWRAVADEWIEAQETNSGDKISDNCPRVDLPQPRLPHNLFNGGVPTTPTHSPLSLSKLFEDVDEKQFFSILPHDDAFAVMENLNKEQDSNERLKLVEFEQDLKLLENTEIGKRITSEFDRKGKIVVGAQHQLKENTIKPLQGKECKDIQSKPKPSSFDTQNRATKHEIDDQLKQNTTNKPQVGLALKANECRNVHKRTQLNQAGDLAKTITSDIDQKPPRCSSYVNHQQKQNIVNTTQVILALPAQQYSGIHEPKPSSFSSLKRAQLSQSGDLKAKGVIHVQQLKQNIASASQANHQQKLEEARKKLKARYEDFENAKKRRAVKVIDPKDLKDLKRKYRKKHQIHI